ncbi:MAG: 30S ribosomal protein S12 methylthiotransferase RimO [Ignavibacteriae bacterium]|nr:30S ribosomal protein S12 methylthiotransferase RimO [Ignavibacteriota bacterium]
MKTRPHTRVALITLGCSKNTVDSEILLRQLEVNGLELADDPNNADAVIINTCGFIDAAKEESIHTILTAAERKKQGALERLYVAGCLSERYKDDLSRDIPEVDAFFGVTDFQRIIETLGGRYRRELLGERHLTTPAHFAYLKISEGCDNPCSFCAIPLMRGGHVSKPIEEVVHEAKLLALHGVRELVVIAQDTTYYGLDLYGERRLAALLRELAHIDGIRWVRLMYAFPTRFPRDVLDVLRDEPSVCAYVDIPVQHAADDVLKSMRRGITRRATRELIDEMRARVPGITIRSTMIVGYPTETEESFDELLRFVEETRFDRLGVFTYSQEDDTAAFALGDPVPQEEKERRRAAVMELQAGISLEKNLAKVGSACEILIDRVEGGYAVGRTEHDAPEVDNEVLVPLQAFPVPPLIGTFVPVRIVEANEFDLIATIAG